MYPPKRRWRYLLLLLKVIKPAGKALLIGGDVFRYQTLADQMKVTEMVAMDKFSVRWFCI